MAAVACDPSSMLGGRRKSFEAEDRGDLALRMRRLENSGITRRSLLPTIPDSSECANSSLLEDRLLSSGSMFSTREERYSGRKNRSLPRANSDSAFSNPKKYPYTDVKRNHSFKSFIQKRIPPSIRRTRNIKQNVVGKENRPYIDSSMVSQSAAGRQPESEIGSFFTPTTESPDMLDLSTEDEAVIRPLHQSILGKEHCFEVITVNGSRCFCCESAGKREEWIEKLKRTLNPNLDNVTRMEHQLNLWIQEAKGVLVRKKYFCEICLDRQLFARTTSKVKDDSTTFWGEHFEFTSIPDIENITIHLYKDSDKKKKKDKDYIGLVNISIKSLLNRQALEKWYTLSTPSGKNKNNSGETMAIRIKARFQSVCVLPMDQYKELGEVISRDYMTLCKALRSALSVSKKDELARSLVCIMQATGTVKEFLTDIVMSEIANVEEESLIFRENTIATKAVEHFLKLVGMGYLHEALGVFISALYESDEDCEVDGSRLPVNAVLEHNQKNLQMCCEIAMCKIIDSIKIFPNELREVFSKWRQQCEACNRPRIASRLITASLFLRLICPAILNPSLFALANEIPRTNAARTLTLVAKVIQNLANRSRFGDKEEYMKFMNGFVRQQWDQMGRFLDDVTDSTKTSPTNGFEGFIDLGRELAQLHAFLTENLREVDQDVIKVLGALPQILANISKRVNIPIGITRKESRDEQRFPNNAPELPSLEEIAEDIQVSNANENIMVSSESSTVLGKSYGNNPKPSLENLPDKMPSLRRAGMDGSQNSLSGSESFNNSNNSQRALVPVENLIKPTDRSGISQSHQPQHRTKPPLSFSNPAYHQHGAPDLKRAISFPTTLTPGEREVEQHFAVFATNDKEDSSRFISHCDAHDFSASFTSNLLHSSYKGRAQPISFSNPLQALLLFPGATSVASAKTNLQSKTEWTEMSPANTVSSNHEAQQVELPFSSINGNDLGSSETESAKGSCQSDDTLSSRPSSTSTGSTANGDRVSVPPQGGEKARAVKLRNRTGVREPSCELHGKQSKVPRSDDVEGKVIAIATSTNIPISSARHRTGLQKQQQQSSRSSKLPHSTSIHDTFGSSKVTTESQQRATPHGLHSSTASVMKSGGFVKAHRAKYYDATTHAARTDPEPVTVAAREDDGRVVPGKNAPVIAYNTASAARVRMTRKTRPASVVSNHSQALHQPKSHLVSERYVNRRNDYQRVTGHSTHQTTESRALPPETPEGPLSPEERTAQWVLSSIAPVPKDLVPQPTSVPPSSSNFNQMKSSKPSNKNYDDTIPRLRIEVDALRTRLSVAEESSRAFREREETLIKQLKDGDRREARLLEKLRIMEDKVARHIQEKEDKKAEFLHRISKAEEEQNRERDELQLVIDEKDAILTAQRKRIASLEETNARLARAINDLETINQTGNSEQTTAIHGSDQQRLHFCNPTANCRNPIAQHFPQNRLHDNTNLEFVNSPPLQSANNVEYRIECSSSAASSSSSV